MDLYEKIRLAGFEAKEEIIGEQETYIFVDHFRGDLQEETM